jgi:hypothetical protein
MDAGWLLLATLPLQAFLSTLGASLATGATQALKRMVGRIHGSQPEAAPAPRPLILQDAATRLMRARLRAGLADHGGEGRDAARRRAGDAGLRR